MQCSTCHRQMRPTPPALTSMGKQLEPGYTCDACSMPLPLQEATPQPGLFRAAGLHEGHHRPKGVSEMRLKGQRLA